MFHPLISIVTPPPPPFNHHHHLSTSEIAEAEIPDNGDEDEVDLEVGDGEEKKEE